MDAGGVPAIAAIFFLNNVFFSLGAPLTLIKLNIAGWSTNYVLNLILSRYMGHQGIALATTVSATLTVILMIVILKRIHLTSLNLKSFSSSISKISVASASMGFLLLMLPNTVNNILMQLQLGYQGLQAAILIVIGAATYLTIARLFKSDELRLLTSAFNKL